ncbi:hypothetical protein [Bavariicoccus seileri]|uniref:hypothetical protein n=1 Tax=Bavariicoccus seileri TaxID=549685 RepID=UPI0005259C3B|nr:hypothetical protein [Bavariicoccus seileri]
MTLFPGVMKEQTKCGATMKIEKLFIILNVLSVVILTVIFFPFIKSLNIAMMLLYGIVLCGLGANTYFFVRKLKQSERDSNEENRW